MAGSDAGLIRRGRTRMVNKYGDSRNMLDWVEWRITQQELAQRQFLVVDAEDPPFAFREAAILWAKERGVVGAMTEEETGGKGRIGISVGSLREMLNPVQIGKSCGLKVHFAAVTVLRELIRESVLVEAYFDRLKGANGIRNVANGLNRNVMIFVGYAAMRFKGGFYRAKLTFKRFADANAASKAYAYHVTRIEVLTGTIGNDLSGTAPNANTSTANQGKANLHLTSHILLNGVVDVNAVPFLDGKKDDKGLECGEKPD